MRRAIATVLAAAGLAGGPALDAAAQNPPGPDADVEMSPISGGLEHPRRHFRLRKAARLKPVEAVNLYDIVRGALRKGYGRSGLDTALKYQTWPKFNSSPYLSVTHGNYYLNNYANAVAAGYGKYERAGTFPVGSIVAKDSFSVTRSRALVLGPLFVMEKMTPGFNEASGDWKYTLVLADGTILGQTKGKRPDRVEYCVDCHVMRAPTDHLYFVPREYRIEDQR